MADQLMNTKEFAVKVSGTWTYFRTISAASAADARDIADLEFQEMDMSDLANTVRAFDFGGIEILK